MQEDQVYKAIDDYMTSGDSDIVYSIYDGAEMDEPLIVLNAIRAQIARLERIAKLIEE